MKTVYTNFFKVYYGKGVSLSRLLETLSLKDTYQVDVFAGWGQDDKYTVDGLSDTTEYRLSLLALSELMSGLPLKWAPDNYENVYVYTPAVLDGLDAEYLDRDESLENMKLSVSDEECMNALKEFTDRLVKMLEYPVKTDVDKAVEDNVGVVAFASVDY